jgi:hypothetical protein
MTAMQTREWHEQEFGRASLGDPRRTRRVVEMAAQLLANPDGRISVAFEKGAKREAAYRFVENDHVEPAELNRARALACAVRMEAMGGYIIVAVDQTSLVAHDKQGVRGFGPIGAREMRVRGVQVMSALAMTPEGMPLGLLDQQLWTRSKQRGPRKRSKKTPRGRTKSGNNKRFHRDLRPRDERESQRWLDTHANVYQIAQEAPRATVWLQCDRGADYWAVVAQAVEHRALITVRVCHDRVLNLANGRTGHLTTWLRRLTPARQVLLPLRARGKERGRMAKLDVCFGKADFSFKVGLGGSSRRQSVPLWVVHVRERSAPRGSRPLRWTLVTTYPVQTIKDAQQVIDNYKLRWRIEDFHKAWKSGACKVESSQLQSFPAFCRWAIITASVAARIEAIKHASRTDPEGSSTLVFSRDEIDTLLVLMNKARVKVKLPYKPGDDPPLAETVRMLGELGGYMKSRNAPPPGTVTLTRGYERLQTAVEAIQAMRRYERETCG